MDFPTGKYDVIYADPPWQYRDRAAAGKRGASFKYPVMSLDEVERLPVRDIASDNCMLFLWATGPFDAKAHEVIIKWGFQYINWAFVWVKVNKNGKPFMGMGHYTRQNAEIVLLAKRGKPKVINHSVSQIIISQRREHSRKPDEARERIVQLMGDVPRIELFARGKVPEGWHAWGNELEG